MTRVIKQTTKTLILNEKGELLLLKIGIHTKQPERSHTIDIPGGFVDEGELLDQGAVREIKEETNIDVNPLDVTLVRAETNYYEDTDASFTHLMYLVKLDHTPEVTVSWEHESFWWVPLDRVLAEYELRPRMVRFIEYVRQYNLFELV